MKIVALKPYIEILKETFPGNEFFSTDEGCTDAEVLIGSPNNFTDDILDRMPNIKWIQSLIAGYDKIDREYLKKRNIILTNSKDIYSVPIAEDVLCKILIHNTNAMRYIEGQKSHTWVKSFPRKEFSGQTVGILGTGSIATEIAKRLHGFDVKVIGYKRSPVLMQPYFDDVFAGKKGLEHVLSSSDYIVVTVDLNKDTYHMINKDNLRLLKSDAAIINIARGNVKNQKDLIEFLKENKDSYAGLDVYDVEPLTEDSELWSMDNVYMTPHVSGITKENKERLTNLVLKNVQNYIDGEQLINIVK
jgi:phosphoglycerate dehydrogenase-like enzyme